MLNVPKVRLSPPSELRIDRIDGGLNTKYIEMQINDNQSPYMVNMNADDRGSLTKRFGTETMQTMASGAIHAMAYFGSKTIVAHGTVISSYVESTDTEAELLTGLADSKGTFFQYGAKLYYINGTNYIEYDGSTCQAVVPYIPTTYIGVKPATGSGTAYEDFNLLGAGFKNSFDGDGAATTYYLTLKVLDATTVTITIAGAAKTEGTHFTVDRTAGTINFAAGTSPHGAPATGTNNVIVTAYKTYTGYADKIKKNKYIGIFGGANDTTVFLAGNTNDPYTYYYSDFTTSGEANYFGVTNYNTLSASTGPIYGFANFYDQLIVFKERGLNLINYLPAETVKFPIYPLNNSLGCDMPYSIQIVDNNIVFANTYQGVFILTRTDIGNEKNVFPISGNVNGSQFREGLLDETKANLQDTSSFDFEGKYYLCAGTKVWIWDYRLSPYSGNEEALSWFYYESIDSNCWLSIDQDLYFGSRTTAKIYKKTVNYNDSGVAISGIWRSKLFNFNAHDWLKSILYIWLTTRANANSTLNIRYYDENSEEVDSEVIAKSDIESFDWSDIDWSNFTWEIVKFPPTIRFKPRIKNVVYFQLEISNAELNENLSILGLTIQFTLNKKVK